MAENTQSVPFSQAVDSAVKNNSISSNDVINLRDSPIKQKLYNAKAYAGTLVDEAKRELNNEPAKANQPVSFASQATKPKKDYSFITKLPTFSARGQAIAKRMDQIQDNPRYQKLPEEKKAKVREDLYNKYVVPSYQGFHLPVPDKETWVGATARKTPFGSKEQEARDFSEHGKIKEFADRLNVGVDAGYTGVKLFGTKVANQAFMALHGMDKYFSKATFEPKQAQQNEEDNFKRLEKVVNNMRDAQKARIQDDDFWIKVHPARTTIGKLGEMTGEQLATLPVYEAVGVEKLGAQVGIPLTAKLMKSPLGKWTASRLINAADGFMASLVTGGGDVKEAAKGGAGFAVMGAAAEPAGKLARYASAPLIKKFLAGVTAMGGKPLAEELIHSAAHEEEQLFAHADSIGAPSTGEALAQIKRATEIQWFMRDTRTQAVRNWMQQQEERAASDPVMHKLHEAGKQSLNSTAIAMYGKPLRGISQKQRQLVRDKALQLVHDAAKEAPVHLPDLLKNDVEDGIEKARKSSPILNSLMQNLEKQGVDFAGAAAENIAKAVAQKTGISNKPAVLGKTAKIAKEVDKAKGEVITPQKFASLISESKAYFRAPRNRTAFADAISDVSKTGANRFIDELKKSIPAGMHFEDPTHRMLFQYGNRKDLPESIVKTLRYRLRQTKGYENITAPALDMAARQMHAHMYDMAKSGHLRSEGNIFRSTRLNGPASFTPWQNQLSDEAVQKEITKTTKALKQHPAAAKTYATLVRALNKDWMKAKTPEEYIAFREELKGTGKKMRKFAKANPFQIGK